MRGPQLRVAGLHLLAGGLELVLALRRPGEGRLQPALEVGGLRTRGLDLGAALDALLTRDLERLVAPGGLEGERLELRLELVDGRHARGQLGDALLELARSPPLLERGVQLDLELRRARAQRLELGDAALELGAQLRRLLHGALRGDALLALGLDGLARRLGGLLGRLYGRAQLEQLALGVARLRGDLVAGGGERLGGGLRVRGTPLGQLARAGLLLVERLGVLQVGAGGGELGGGRLGPARRVGVLALEAAQLVAQRLQLGSRRRSGRVVAAAGIGELGLQLGRDRGGVVALGLELERAVLELGRLPLGARGAGAERPDLGIGVAQPLGVLLGAALELGRHPLGADLERGGALGFAAQPLRRLRERGLGLGALVGERPLLRGRGVGGGALALLRGLLELGDAGDEPARLRVGVLHPRGLRERLGVLGAQGVELGARLAPRAPSRRRGPRARRRARARGRAGASRPPSRSPRARPSGA